MSELLLTLESVLGSLVSALIFLALVIKAVLYPLARWAYRGVADNQALAKKLEPELKAIRSTYRGEEQSERILALYKKHSFNPFGSLKATLVLLIQIPVFIGVYSAVSNDTRFQGESLWQIADVTRSDELLSFSGLTVNLLPVLMLAVSIANLLVMRRLQQMQRSQELTGWVIAFGFFILLYGSPAALVIYWTVNILLQWLLDWILLRRKA